MDGKDNDCRIDLAYILQVTYNDYTVSETITKYEFNKPNSYFINKYIEAKHINKIYGKSPNLYITKESIK